MKIREFISKIKDALFYPKWKCLSCGHEIFDGEYFCEECKEKLPFNDGAICDHCGRKLNYGSKYCTTCNNYITSVDKARSVFTYDKFIGKLIKKAKYNGAKYLLEIFAEYMSNAYFKYCFNADCIVYVPMSYRAQKRRGYNQSEIIARKLSDRIKVGVVDAVVKTKNTKRQATLNRTERIKNLIDAFRVIDRKEIKDKTVLIVDDVSTTGATAEAVANKLKKAGAKTVYLLSLASVPPKQGY